MAITVPMMINPLHPLHISGEGHIHGLNFLWRRLGGPALAKKQAIP